VISKARLIQVWPIVAYGAETWTLRKNAADSIILFTKTDILQVRYATAIDVDKISSQSNTQLLHCLLYK